jgi:hypothetical protein
MDEHNISLQNFQKHDRTYVHCSVLIPFYALKLLYEILHNLDTRGIIFHTRNFYSKCILLFLFFAYIHNTFLLYISPYSS